MMFGIDSLYIWLAVIIISVAVEAFTLTLCGIWFAAGGVAALIAASLSVGLMGQWIVFIVFSAICVIALALIGDFGTASALPPFSRQPAAGDQRRSYHRTDCRCYRTD